MTAAQTKTAAKAETFASHPTAADEAVRFGRSNVAAVIDVASIWFSGTEELTRGVFALAQTQFDANIGAARALIGIESLGELPALHKAYARTAFDNVVSEASRLTEIAIRVSNEAAEPLTDRLQALVDRLPKLPLAV